MNLLKPLLDHFVAPTQQSFKLGHVIYDNVVIYQEFLHSFQRKRGPIGHMMIKLDLEKAYDKLSWSLIHETLTFFGLASYWISLIMNFISTGSLKILWDGEHSLAFHPGCGIRQGDLFPYIFVQCLERPSHLINAKVDSGEWKPISLSQRGPSLSHLMFIDDVILFLRLNSTKQPSSGIAWIGFAVRRDKRLVILNPQCTSTLMFLLLLQAL